jgi:hypothetical protein
MSRVWREGLQFELCASAKEFLLAALETLAKPK